jgi:tellurite resistance protein
MMSVMHKVEVLRAACCVAGIDGETTDRERALLQKLAGQIGVGQASLQAMIDRAEGDKKFYEEQFRQLKTKPDTTMRVLLTVGLADGDLPEDECSVLRAFAIRLGLSEEKFERVLRQAREHVEQATSE